MRYIYIYPALRKLYSDVFARCFVWKRPIYEAWGLTCFSLNGFCEVSCWMFFNKATNTNCDVDFRMDSVMKSLDACWFKEVVWVGDRCHCTISWQHTRPPSPSGLQ